MILVDDRGLFQLRHGARRRGIPYLVLIYLFINPINKAMDEMKRLMKKCKNPLITEDLLLKCLRARGGKVVMAKHLVARYIVS